MSPKDVIEKLQELFAGEEEFWVEESLRGDSTYRAECLARAQSFQTAREWTESMSVWVK